MKRYFVEFTSDRIICQSKTHVYGYASTLKAAKGYINRIRKTYAADHPQDFRIYDTQGEAPENEHVPCVYYEK